MIRQIVPSTSIWVPFLNWLVEIIGAEGSVQTMPEGLTDAQIIERLERLERNIALIAERVGVELEDPRRRSGGGGLTEGEDGASSTRATGGFLEARRPHRDLAGDRSSTWRSSRGAGCPRRSRPQGGPRCNLDLASASASVRWLLDLRRLRTTATFAAHAHLRLPELRTARLLRELDLPQLQDEARLRAHARTS